MRRLRRAAPIAFVLLLLPCSGPRAQVSPGPLSKAHADLEGARNCLKCHGRGEGSADQHCLDCHQEVDWLLEHDRGLHAGVRATPCARCHPEHAGLEFELISWEGGGREKFDHRTAGWPLEGKHAALACAQCHKPEFQRAPVLPLLKSSHPAKSLLGLAPECAACHDDVHRGALGADCRSCHGLDAWKPVAGFDHAKAAFPLSGKHAQVECAKCHLSPRLALSHDAQGKPVPIYKPLPHRECSDCHQDPHAGRLGAACASCHATAAWAAVEKSAFDHARTRYPLLGRHRALPCAACHDPAAAWGKTPRFDACGRCHSDAHAGLATLAGAKVDCASCHRVEGWSPSTYTVAQHDSSAYPLAGKHRQVACLSCHLKSPPGAAPGKAGVARVLLRPPHARCRDCHQDAHAGQLGGPAERGACESCHRVDGWKPSTFGAAQHASLRLPLEGRHREAECAACHGPVRKGLPPLPGPEVLGRARVLLTPLSPECTACHTDPHRGRFASGGAAPIEGGCLACHDADAFRPSRVDVALHRRSGFALEGAHRAVPCIACHPELKAAPPASTLVAAAAARDLKFTAEHERCASCHLTPHGEQFAARSDGGACDACHDVAAFRPATPFDHARAAFAIDGAHAKVACAKCHPSAPDAEGRPRVTYRPIPHRCQDCHRGAPPKGAGS